MAELQPAPDDDDPPARPPTPLPSAGDGSWRQWFERNPWPMWVYDRHTLQFLAVNHAAEAAYGHRSAEFLALRITDIRPPSEQQRLVEFLRDARRDDAPPGAAGRHWQHQRANGEVFDVEVYSQAIEFEGRAARLVVAKDITQRLRAERALRDSERRYRTIVETATEGIWMIDAQARTSFVNPTMAQMLGHTVDAMVGRPLTDFMDEEGTAIVQDHLARRRQGVAEQHDFRFRHRDGHAVWARVSTNPILDDAGGYAGALAMVTDISERRAVEQQLKLLATSVDRFNDIVIITEAEPLDEPGPRILFVNDAFERRTGWRRDEVIGRTPRLLQGPGTDRAELDRIHAALRAWQPVRAELLNYTRSGQPFWLTLDIVPIADDRGWYTHWVAVEHDITALKRTQARDASRNHVTALIAEGAPLQVVLTAIASGLESLLPHLRCGVNLLDAGGTRLRHGAAPSMPAFFNEAVDGLPIGPTAGSCGTAAWHGRRVVCEDVQTDPAWADWRELAARAGVAAAWSEPVLSAAGAVLGTFGVYHATPGGPDADELALVSESARLAAIAIERKHADDALRQSQKMESLGTLAGGIAHDFNNILGAILGNLALARLETPRGQDPTPRLDQIQQSALRARHLVQQILTFSRRQPHQAVCQPMKPLVEEAVALLRATLPAGVRLHTRLADGLPPVAVDATQLQQVLMNLCTNAWHAVLGGRAGTEGEIEIGLDRLPADAAASAAPAALAAGGGVHLWVRDNGTGMDASIQARIFEPFFTTKPVGTGTGLGLAVVHGIVSEHGGAITVDSAPGRGTTFHLYFPAGQPVPQAASAAPADTGGRSLPPPTARADAPHILCVDDDEVILLTDEGLLRQQGYRVTALASGREAVAAVRDAPDRFDLVVSDYNMPGVSGLDVARDIAAIRPDLPVLLCSGYIDADLHQRARQAGVRSLVHKENLAEDLAPAIRRLLGGAP